MNPYNCTLPGNLFTGYEEIRHELREDLRGGKSFALLGGRRCGKTSFLLQMEKDLNACGLAGFDALPRFLDIQGLTAATPEHLFSSVYQLVVRGTDARPRRVGETGSEYEDFLRALDAAQSAMDGCHGRNWLVILLVDELDSAIAALPDDQFFQNLRNLLMVSRFHHRFRLVASGVREMSRLIASGSSPLNNLCHAYLRVLTPAESGQLIAAGFPTGLGEEAEPALLQATGRHPYLMQGLLEKLWKKTTPPTRLAVEAAGREFLREHKDFRRWLDGFSPAELGVYQCLAEASPDDLSEAQLRRQARPSVLPNLDEALTVLGFHGIIEDSDPERLAIAGTLFRDWWRQNRGMAEEENTAEPALPVHVGNSSPADSRSWDDSIPQSMQSTVNTEPSRAGFSPLIADHVLVGNRPFGGGAYGQVWLAKNVMGTYRAVKVICRSTFSEARPFEREFNGIKSYEPISRMHSGLVQILQVGRNHRLGYFYYVMELGDDTTAGQEIQPLTYSPNNLGRELERLGRMPLEACASLGLSMIDALAFLHQHGLIHRDIKPSNVIFVNGAPKLADVGLVTSIRTKTGDASWVGTEGYCAPEGPGTAAGDIYSLGKLLYRAYTGLECKKFPTIPRALALSDGPALAAWNEVLLKACQSDAGTRYQTAAQMRADLLKFMPAFERGS